MLAVFSLPPSGGLALAQSLSELRQRANSDDARNASEANTHALARAAVIRSIEPNQLRLGGATFRVKRNPSGPGSFVYEPQTRFNGVERKLVWWVSDGGSAYPVNGASKTITPGLDFPPQSAVQRPDQIIAYVFGETPLPAFQRDSPATVPARFTVKEYHAYRLVIDIPMSASEAQAHARAGRCLGMTPADVASTVRKVQGILLQNKWMGRAADEVRHASDWKDDPPTPKC